MLWLLSSEQLAANAQNNNCIWRFVLWPDAEFKRAIDVGLQVIYGTRHCVSVS